jgi:hypothetical protein
VERGASIRGRQGIHRDKEWGGKSFGGKVQGETCASLLSSRSFLEQENARERERERRERERERERESTTGRKENAPYLNLHFVPLGSGHSLPRQRHYSLLDVLHQDPGHDSRQVELRRSRNFLMIDDLRFFFTG